MQSVLGGIRNAIQDTIGASSFFSISSSTAVANLSAHGEDASVRKAFKKNPNICHGIGRHQIGFQ
jgi:hypothetical protein